MVIPRYLLLLERNRLSLIPILDVCLSLRITVMELRRALRHAGLSSPTGAIGGDLHRNHNLNRLTRHGEDESNEHITSGGELRRQQDR
jgi:hypothetical protein